MGEDTRPWGHLHQLHDLELCMRENREDDAEHVLDRGERALPGRRPAGAEPSRGAPGLVFRTSMDRVRREQGDQGAPEPSVYS